MTKTLIFVPTYNERENAGEMLAQLLNLDLDADILFLDDNSPDGTGKLLDDLSQKQERVQVVHRAGKLGIGSAHLHGIKLAYAQGYTRLLTMDCDFTHSPKDIARLLEHADHFDIVVGSRYLEHGGLTGWNLLRRFLTTLGHFLTKSLLKIPQDATGAFRVYNIDRIPSYLFGNVKSTGYSFFFESLFLLGRNDCTIREVPIVLPARTYGHSKMSLVEASRSAVRIIRLWLAMLVKPSQFRVSEPFSEVDMRLNDPQGWDLYWRKKEATSGWIYDLVATGYRNLVIRRRLNRTIRKHFCAGAHLLHAGCGSGEVDGDIQRHVRITAVDISVEALQLYKQNNPRAQGVKHASILDLPFGSQTFDGVYNLGVLEHFTETQILTILSEMWRVVKVGGKLVIFWPHAKASSVGVLRFVHWLLNDVMKAGIQLHPPEISLLTSKGVVESLVRGAGFDLIDYYFGIRDLCVQAVIVAQKNQDSR